MTIKRIERLKLANNVSSVLVIIGILSFASTFTYKSCAKSSEYNLDENKPTLV